MQVALVVEIDAEVLHFAERSEGREAIAVDKDVVDDSDIEDFTAGYEFSGSAEVFVGPEGRA